MSRSKKKTPIQGITTASTEKNDKRAANRKYRRITKIQVNKGEGISDKNEISNVWSFAKDGKSFIKNHTKKDLRK